MGEEKRRGVLSGNLLEVIQCACMWSSPDCNLLLPVNFSNKNTLSLNHPRWLVNLADSATERTDHSMRCYQLR